jgi:hypothetical protein
MIAMIPKPTSSETRGGKLMLEALRLAKRRAKLRDRLLLKLRSVVYFDTLYAMEREFNSVGLSIQCTTCNRQVLCRVCRGKPIIGNMLDDYIFIGSLDNKNAEVPEKLLSVVTDFMMNNAGSPCVLMNAPRKWQRNTSTYGQILIVHEDVQRISLGIID